MHYHLDKASWRILSKFALVNWGNSISKLIVSSVPCSGYYGLVTSMLASICSQVEGTLLVGDEQAELQLWAWKKQQTEEDL
jgi:hypothetical protein